MQYALGPAMATRYDPDGEMSRAEQGRILPMRAWPTNDWFSGVLDDVRRGVEDAIDRRQIDACGPAWVDEAAVTIASRDGKPDGGKKEGRKGQLELAGFRMLLFLPKLPYQLADQTHASFRLCSSWPWSRWQRTKLREPLRRCQR